MILSSRHVLVISLALGACGKSEPPAAAKAAAPATPPALQPAPAATWTKDRVRATLVLAGDEMTLSLSCCNKAGLAPVNLHAVPRGATVTIGRTTWQPKLLEGQEKAGMATFEADPTDAFAAAPLDTLRVEAKPPAPMVDLDLPVTVELPRHEKVVTHVSVPAELEWSLFHLLAHVVSGPVKLASDASVTAGAPDAAVILWEPSTGFMSVHKRTPGLTVADLDWVAVPAPVPSGKQKKCSGYAAIGGAATHSATFELAGLDVTVYERRTGAVVGKKSFPPPTSCPTMMTSGDTMLLPSRAPVDAWLEAALVKGKLE
jgi:hypothetical protein